MVEIEDMEKRPTICLFEFLMKENTVLIKWNKLFRDTIWENFPERKEWIYLLNGQPGQENWPTLVNTKNIKAKL